MEYKCMVAGSGGVGEYDPFWGGFIHTYWTPYPAGCVPAIEAHYGRADAEALPPVV